MCRVVVICEDGSVLSVQYQGEGAGPPLIRDLNHAASRLIKKLPFPLSKVDCYSSLRRKDPSLAPTLEPIDEVTVALSYFHTDIQQRLKRAINQFEEDWKEDLQKQEYKRQEIDQKQLSNQNMSDPSSASQVIQSFYEKWKAVDEISAESPLIMFHQRKAGGSSIRITLHFASLLLGLPTYISCYTKPCDAYHVDYDEPYAIYAGHYAWGLQNRLAKFSTSMRSSQFSCITNFRHPVDRINSCLYFRFPDMLSGRCLDELTLEEFKSLLYTMGDYGNSCLNEPFRMLSGETNEIMLDHMMNEHVDQLLSSENIGEQDQENSRRRLKSRKKPGRVHSQSHYQRK
jgi:hypothetical protein